MQFLSQRYLFTGKNGLLFIIFKRLLYSICSSYEIKRASMEHQQIKQRTNKIICQKKHQQVS